MTKLFRAESQDSKWIGDTFSTEGEALDDGRANQTHLWPSFLLNLRAFRDGAWASAGTFTTREIELTLIALDGSVEVVTEPSFTVRLPEKMLRLELRPRDSHWQDFRACLYAFEANTGADCYGVNRATYRAVEVIEPERVICSCCGQFKEETWSAIAARLGVASPV